MSKLITTDSLAKLSAGLDARYKALINNSVSDMVGGSIDAAQASILAEVKKQVDEVKEMLGGKALVYLTQAEYNALPEEKKNDENIVYNITDSESADHEHENLELLNKLTTINITIGNKTQVLDFNGNLNFSLEDIGVDNNHKHDEYYTEEEINNVVSNLEALISNKSDTGHNHNDKYYTETEINTMLANKANKTHEHTDLATVDSLNSAVNTINAAIAKKSDKTHNHDGDYYNKTEATTKFNDIEGDITSLGQEITALNTSISSAETRAKSYADQQITALVNSAPEAMDTLGELAKAISDHSTEYEAYVATVSANIATAKAEAIAEAAKKDTALHTTISAEIDADVKVEKERAEAAENALQAAINKKSDDGHTHDGRYYTESEINTKLAAKADSSHGNHVPATQTASNKTFLRNDNTWATVTPANIGAAPSSHTHDDIYFTETEINTKIEDINETINTKEAALQAAINGKAASGHNHNDDYAKGESISATLPATAGWYRIANSTASQGAQIGLFIVKEKLSESHSESIITAGTSHGKNPTLQQLAHTAYSTYSITKARLVYIDAANGTTAYLEVYLSKAQAVNISVDLLGNEGWELITPVAGSVPTNYASKELTFSSNRIIANVTGSLSGNASSATKLQNARNITIGNKTNSFNGSGDISYSISDIGAAPASHTHDDRYFTETEMNGKIEDINKTINSEVATLTAEVNKKLNKADHGTHLALGTTSSTAFRGDYGNTAYNHSQAAHAPVNAQKNSDITKAEIEAKLTGSITSHNHNGSYYTKTNIDTKISDINDTINTKEAALQASINGKAPSGHTHTVLTMKNDNFKKNSDLPSSYERGETLFFSNNQAAEDRFNSLNYGLIQTLKEYSSGSAAWQFLYPYNASNDKFYVRNAQYSTDSWRSWAEVYTSLNKPTPADIGASASGHTHDDRYFTETEMNTKLAGKSDTGHTHDDRYYTETEINGKIEDINTTINTNVATLTAEVNKKLNKSDHGAHLALGTTSSTAFRGDYGNTAYNHSQAAHAPSNAQKNSDITKAEIEAKLTGSITSHNHNGQYYTETEINGKIEDINETISEKEAALQASINGKAPSNHGSHVAYGTCATAAATAAKVVSVSDTSWKLTTGCMVAVKFSATNSAGNVTLNVNSTGAYPIWYNNAAYTGNSNKYTGYANRVLTYMFNGTHWVWISGGTDDNTTYSNASLGQGYATCDTAESTVAKVGTLSNYSLTAGGVVSVKFTYKVPASATLNINSKGAKAIYFRGAAITANIINAGDIATFIYNGSQYQLISIDRWQNDITSHNHDGRYYTEAEINTKISDINNTIDSKEAALQASIDQVEGMLGGRSIKYVTQAQYNNLSAAEKESNTVTYFITDLSEEHNHNDLYYTETEVDAKIEAVYATLERAEGLKTVTTSNNTLTLTTDKRQYCANVPSGTTIAFPSVSKFTEVHLYFSTSGTMNLNFPDTVKWRVDPNIDAGSSYELVATYVNAVMGWMVNIMSFTS